ncbi:MAG: hypothetical protein ACTHLW_08040, partial [Verrucomicrobiota bacterium]
GTVRAVLINKDTNGFVQVSLNLGTAVRAARRMELAGPTLYSTNGYTLGGAAINPDGSWAGSFQSVLPAANGQLSVLVSPLSAVLLDPVTEGANVAFSLEGNVLSLSWPSNYVGWLLQSNTLGLAHSDGWSTVPGSASTNFLQFPMDPAPSSVFYRLAAP